MIHPGLGVHHDSIAVFLAPSGATEVRRHGIIGGRQEHVQRLIANPQARLPSP